MTLHNTLLARNSIVNSILVGIMSGVLVSTSHGADFTSYSGEQLFQRLCASCHGPAAKGDGPVASALNKTVPNLRQITQRNRGQFPADKIARIIDGRTTVIQHGTRLMPVWGDELLRSEAGDPEAERAEAALVSKLVEYLRGIQDGAR